MQTAKRTEKLPACRFVSCPKCETQSIKREELVMYGKGGAMGSRGYRFDVYVCEKCGFVVEMYFREKSS